METRSYSIDRLLIGASGSIGVVNLIPFLLAFKVARFAKEVQVIMTDTAAKMIPPSTVRLFCDGVHTSLFDEEGGKVRHIKLGEWPQMYAVLPASANLIGKLANGICDDLLTTTAIAAKCPVAIFPNMNFDMFNKSVVQRNLSLLESDGHFVIPPLISEAYEVATGEMVKAATLHQPSGIMEQLLGVLDFINNQRNEG
ncbi:flavoprotein [Tumebacillus flagellatus]|uniref:Flavoprotein domain-containing protein n=1 Tax=Tumebacillus flagellatus TaxID=1157490 RepID=A0A074LVE3_9BACL|nr:flavoprotein [Tumebacillus flagellatus]KEO83963.1 hypothetical protein EL26_07185 [Tumebacillus flagellatus]